MFWSWPASAFVDGVKIGSANRSASRRPAGIGVPWTVPLATYSFYAWPGQVAADDALEREHLGPPHEHRPAGHARHRRRAGRHREAAAAGTRATISAGSAVTMLLGARSASSSFQNAVIAVSTRPLSGIGSAKTTSNALIRSDATISRSPSPAS